MTVLTAVLSLGDIVLKAAFRYMGELVLWLVGQLFSLAAQLIDLVINKVGFSGTYKVIAETGWKVSRDFTNMIFILVMVLIAFGTILRIEQYGVGKLLPKLIIVALLINFSLPISYLFIDISNLTADSFLKSLSTESKSLRATLVDATRTNIMLMPADCQIFDDAIEKANCENTNKTRAQISDEQGLIETLASVIIACIFILLATFVLFAGAIMLITRLLYLAFLVILAPLAFMCYMVPSLSRYWKDWWSNLMKWCFFAPIFMFFFWLAIATVKTLENNLKSISTLNDAGTGFITKFFANITNAVGYFLFLGLILGGLIAAQKMGIAGANVAMSMVQKAKKGATSWAKSRFVTRPSQLVGGGAQKMTGAVIKHLPGLKTVGAKMEARGKLIQQKTLSADQIKKAKQLYEQFSPKDLSDAMGAKMLNLKPAEQLALAQVAASEKYVNKIDGTAAAKAADVLQNFGYKGDADKLRDARLDGLDDASVEKRIKELQASGDLGNISPKALESPKVVALLARICKAEELETIRAKSKRHENTINKSLTDLASVPANATNKDIQYAYTAQTGDTSKLGGLTSVERQEFTAKYAVPAQLKRIKINMTSPLPGTSQADIISNIPKNGFRTTIEGMDKESASYIVRFIKANRSVTPQLNELYAVINSDPYLNALG